MGTIKTKTCINCGEFFETVDGRKRMCPACEAKAKEERQNKAAKKAMTNLAALEAKNPEAPKKNEALDAKFADLHAQGKTYAEAQKEETLRMVGGVTVMQSGDGAIGGAAAETPEQKRVRIITSEEAEYAWRFARAIHRNMADYEADEIFGNTFFNAVTSLESDKECIDTILGVLE